MTSLPGKHLLLISFFYPPQESPRSFRWGAITETWARQGHQVDVLTAWTPGLAQTETLNGVTVYRVNLFLLRFLYQWFSSGTDSGSQQSLEPVPPNPNLIGRLIRWIYYQVYANLYWPDAGAYWLPSAVRKLRQLLQTQSYDAIYSSSPFFTAHLVTALAGKKRSTTRWIVDNGDPFFNGDHNNARLYGRLNHRAEGWVFKQADRISVTTPQLKTIYTDMFPESSVKIDVIPPLLSIPERPSEPSLFFPADNVIRLIYLGKLYRQTRNPAFTLKLFAELLRRFDKGIELHIIGDTGEVENEFEPYSEWLGSQIILHGSLSRERALAAMWSADVLVNIGNATSYQLPSKVVEYASTGKPILNVTSRLDDSSAEFFQTYPSALTLCEADEVTIDEYVSRLIQFLNRDLDPLAPDWIREWLSPHSLESISEQYLQL